jgi:hypothetical protein
VTLEEVEALLDRLEAIAAVLVGMCDLTHRYTST